MNWLFSNPVWYECSKCSVAVVFASQCATHDIHKVYTCFLILGKMWPECFEINLSITIDIWFLCGTVQYVIDYLLFAIILLTLSSMFCLKPVIQSKYAHLNPFFWGGLMVFTKLIAAIYRAWHCVGQRGHVSWDLMCTQKLLMEAGDGWWPCLSSWWRYSPMAPSRASASSFRT